MNTRIPRVKINNKITSISDLDIAMSQIKNSFAEYMANLAKEFMQDYITEKVYMENALGGSDSNEYYDRTGDLLNAVVCSQTANGSWSINIDGRKIRPIQRTDTSMFGQHVDFNNNSQAGMMSTFINEGTEMYNGIDYISATENYINSIYLSEWEKFKSYNNL